MYLNIVHSCKHVRLSVLSAFLCVLCTSHDVKAVSWSSVDKAVFNIAVQTARYAISAGTKIVLNNPRIAAVALAIYYRNEIFNFAKDTTGYLVGEYPYISLLAVIASMTYFSFMSYDYQDNQEQQDDDSE